MLKRTPGTQPTVLLRGARGHGAGTPTTMWGLLVWAYKRELVRVCEGRVGHDGAGYGSSSTGTVCRVLETGIVGSGPVARVTKFPVHADAEYLHGIVRSLDRDQFWLVVNSAEADRQPSWDVEVTMLSALPVLKANGKPRMLVCPTRNRPVACRVQYRGLPPAKAEAIRQAARDRYADWYRLLWAIREKCNEENCLTRWHITGIGAEPEPWRSFEAAGC